MTPDTGTELPTGVLTFCLTDLEDSTMYWDRDATAMGLAVSRHQKIVSETVAEHRGVILLAQGEGDSTVSVFVSPGDAVRAAADIHRRLASEPWPAGLTLRARIGLHTGEAEQRDGTYYGTALNRAGRIRALAAGGQTFLSLATAKLVEGTALDRAVIRPLGSVELRGLSQAEQIHALDLEDSGDVARLDTGPKTNAPVMLTTFVGRRAERERIRQTVAESRIVTIVGPGGSGKTRLAVEISHDIAADGGTPVRFVDLAPIRDGGLVADTVASVVGVSGDQPGDTAEDRVVKALGSRPSLLVLDNCEHLIGAVSELVTAIVSRCSDVRVLATSQVPLGSPGEALMPLAPLTLPTPGASDEEMAEAEAVKLLVDRAKRHDPEFRLSPSNADALAEVCRRLDGLPLALELAAAHLRLLTPDQMLERLGADRFRLLGPSRTPTESRHQALEPTLDWSYGLLDERARLLLNRLSVFSGGFTLPAAEAICSSDDLPAADVYETLAELVSRSLIASRNRGGQMRYWLLETIREYAAKKLVTAAAARTAAWMIKREGQYWTVEADRVVRLRDSKGLGYLSDLVERANVDVHVLDLIAPGMSRVGTGDVDEVLDATARDQYRRRIDDLRAEIDQAKAANDLGRVGLLEEELETVVAELTGATGLGGRARRTAGAAERARMSVTKALRGAIAAIEKELPTVGAHLDRSIRTGMQCSYRPDGAERLTLGSR